MQRIGKLWFRSWAISSAAIFLAFSLLAAQLITYQPSSATIENENHLPRARAGADQTVYEGALVTLNGTASRDPDKDALNYEWTQAQGRKVVLSDPTSPSPSFLAPNIKNDRSIFVFNLTVSDGSETGSDTDSVRITVLKSENSGSGIDQENHPPIANAGEDQYVQDGRTQISLNGSSSYDPDDDTITYSWIQIAGPAVDLQNATSALAQFSVAELPDIENMTFVFDLTISDGFENGTSEDTMNVVLNTQTTNDGNSEDPAGQPPSGQQGNSEIHGTVFSDSDADGILDASEVGVSDAKISLFGYDRLDVLAELGPESLAYSQNSGKLYGIARIPDSFNQTLVVIDSSTWQVINQVPIGDSSSPVYPAVAVNPSTGLVYVSNGADLVYVIDDESGEIVDSIPLPVPGKMRVDAAQNLIYVKSDSSILVLDGTSQEVKGIAANSNGDFAVDSELGLIYLPEASYSCEPDEVHQLPCPEQLTAYDLTTGELRFSTALPTMGAYFGRLEINEATHIVYGAVHHISSCNSAGCTDEDSYLAIFNPVDNGRLVTRADVGTAPWELAVNPLTNLVYVSDVVDNTVTIIDGSEGTNVASLEVRKEPHSIVIDTGTNSVYVSSFGISYLDPPILPAISLLSGSRIDYTLSGDDGSYFFGNLSSGNYVVKQIVQGEPEILFTKPATGSYQLLLPEAEVASGLDFADAPAEKIGTLTIRSGYLEAEGGLAGIPIRVMSGEEEITQGTTPVSFALPGDREYTVIAENIDFNFFSQWSDNGSTNASRQVFVAGGDEVELIALYVSIPSSNVVEVNASASVADSNGGFREISGVDSNVQSIDTIREILDHGKFPRTYRLADGEVYHIFAVNSRSSDSPRYVFDHWIDPVTGESVSSRELVFTASDGLVLHAIYRETNSTLFDVSVKSKLVNGTELTGMFNKIDRLIFADDNPSDLEGTGQTPNEYHLEADNFYKVSGSDFDGLVLDHWEATGGPYIDRIVFSNEYQFDTLTEDSRVDSLTAVYRVIADDNFASVPVETKGEHVIVEIPEKINDGVSVEFEKVETIGNVTAAQTDILDDFDIFDGISLSNGNATIVIDNSTSQGPIASKVLIYGTEGPVLRINDAYLSVEGNRTVTIHYDPLSIPEGSAPRILHFNGTSWEDVTIGVNFENQTITGTLKSLSPIVAGYSLPGAKFGIGGIGIEGGAVFTPGLGSNVSLSAELGRSGELDIKFERIESAGELAVVPRPLDIDENIRDLIDKGYITPDSKFGIGGVHILVESSENAAVGAVFQIEPAFEYSGNIEVTIPYDPGLLPEGASESDVKFLHYTGSRWKDETVRVNTSENTVTALLDSLSPVVAAVPIFEPPPSGGGGDSGHGGGGKLTPPVPNVQPTIRPLDNETVQGGANVTAILSVDKLGIISMNFENVTAPGNIILNIANTSDFREAFVNSTEASSFVDGSEFVTLGKIYNISRSAALEFSGKVVVTVPYNSTTGISEETIRLLQLVGIDKWLDITTSLNQTSNMVRGVSYMIGPIVVVTVHDGTFGEKYFEYSPLARVAVNETDNLPIESDLSNRVPIAFVIKNLQRSDQPYVFVVQIADSAGVAQYIGLETGYLSGGQSKEIFHSWTAEKEGHYTARIFVLSEMDSPLILSSVAEKEFELTSASARE